jgi:transcriptional regulator with XRE-family HTH domain
MGAAEQWRRGVPIGETLVRARHQAGLTLAQVSKRTRIRETIIRKIEADDFSECGGDFYARGHIRAIAKAAGIDPEPLIEDYDTDHRATGPMATVSLDELLATSAPQRHRPDLPAWARVTAAGAPAARKASAGAARGRRAGPFLSAWRS